MGDSDFGLGAEEDADQRPAEASQPEELKVPTSARAFPARGIIRSRFNPFVLCSVLSQRTRQLVVRHPGRPLSQLIKIAMAEFREGKLQRVNSEVSFQLSGANRDPIPDRRTNGPSNA